MIYVIQAKNGAFKIGYTKSNASFKRRLKALRTSHSMTLTPVLLVEGEMHHEKALHKLLNKFCTRGEWFSDLDWADMLLRHVIVLLAQYGAPFVLEHTEDQLQAFCQTKGGILPAVDLRCLGITVRPEMDRNVRIAG